MILLSFRLSKYTRPSFYFYFCSWIYKAFHFYFVIHVCVVILDSASLIGPLGACAPGKCLCYYSAVFHLFSLKNDQGPTQWNGLISIYIEKNYVVSYILSGGGQKMKLFYMFRTLCSVEYKVLVE